MSATIPPKKIILALLVVLISTYLSGCMQWVAPEVPGQEPPSQNLDDQAPPGNNEPAGSMALADDPLPTPMLPQGTHSWVNSLPLKPVTFRNLGTAAYTVSAWTYAPLDPAYPAIPSQASTVAFPGGSNPSSSLSLPLGTYTWCYWWELGDINGDDMIEYAHAFDTRPILLDENDSDDLDLAEIVELSAPAPSGAVYGKCGLDFAPFVVGQQHADNIVGAFINMGHDMDSVTLRGPITVAYWYIHAAESIRVGVPREMTEPVVVAIPAGETHTFELVDGREDHPGDWNMYIWLLSIDG